MEDIEDIDDDDYSMSDEVETKRYKCSSPRRRHRSLRSPDLDFEYDDCDFISMEDKTMPVDMPASHKHIRTFSNSSETDE
jgi:hypothetical protein